jgi:hypothetical protein
MTAPASAEKSRGPPLRARSARLRDAQNRGGKPTHRACRAKRPQRNRAIFETERALPNAATARRMPPTIDRPERADDRRRARRTVVWRGLGLDAPTTARGPRRALQLDRPSRSPRPPPPAHHPPRTDRGAHCRGPAFSETGTRLPPRQRARHRQRRGRARSARDPWPALDVAPSHAGLRLPPAVEPSRRSRRRDRPPTAPRDRGERKSDALPKGARPERWGSKGARLSARRRHRQGRGTRHEGSGASP